MCPEIIISYCMSQIQSAKVGSPYCCRPCSDFSSKIFYLSLDYDPTHWAAPLDCTDFGYWLFCYASALKRSPDSSSMNESSSAVGLWNKVT